MNNILEAIQLHKKRIQQRREELNALEALKQHITPGTYYRVKGNAEKAIQEAEQEVNNIVSIIEQHPHELKRRILYLYWAEDLTFTETAERLAYSEDHIRHLHAEAVKEINKTRSE